MKFVVATNNAHKLTEIRRILSPLGIEAVSLREAGADLGDVEETGADFFANSYIKAQAACKHTGMPVIADDSGLCVDALDGAPGIFSARYAGENATDAQRIEKLLDALKDIPMEKRGAQFICSICCLFPDGNFIRADGIAPGKIALTVDGIGGFGYDPVFISETGATFAALSDAEKDTLSHRGRALRELSRLLTGKE